MGFYRPLQVDESRFGTCICGKKARRKIFVSIMKWQSPNFIKAKCSRPSTIVHSFYFWKAFIVLINGKGFCGGRGCKLCGVVPLHHLVVRSGTATGNKLPSVWMEGFHPPESFYFSVRKRIRFGKEIFLIYLLNKI